MVLSVHFLWPQARSLLAAVHIPLFLQIEEVSLFVHVVDNTIRIQEETERVKDVMNRITGYNVGDVPHELRDVSNYRLFYVVLWLASAIPPLLKY